MFTLLEGVETTAFFRRTDAPVFDPLVVVIIDNETCDRYFEFMPLTLVALAIPLSVYIWHFSLFSMYVVDFPRSDDFWLLQPPLLEKWPPWSWFWEQYLEHRYAVLKAISWLLYRLGNRDFLLIQYFGFLTFGILVASIVWIHKKRNMDWRVASVFSAFLVSPLLIENHVWAVLISIHLCYLFFFWGAHFLHDPASSQVGWKKRLLGIALLFLAAASDANAVPLCLVLGLGTFAIEAARGRWKAAVLWSILTVLPAVIYLIGYRGVRPYPYAMPWDERLWIYFKSQAQAVFWYVKLAPSWRGILATLLVLAAPIVWLVRRRAKLNSQEWFELLMYACTLATLFAVAMSRATNDSEIHVRYCEYSVMLLPWLMVIWFRALGADKRAAVILCLFFLFQLRLHKNPELQRFYQYYHQGRVMTLDCIHKQLAERRPEIYCTYYASSAVYGGMPERFTEVLVMAKKLGFSFTEKLDLDYLRDKK